MPAFYNSRTAASQMPITPPDSGSGYQYSNMYPQNTYAPHPSLNQPRHESAYDYSQSYMHPAAPPAPAAYPYQQSNYQPTTTLPPIANYHEPIGAPILPPLRINEHPPFNDDDYYQRRHQQEQHAVAAREQQREVVKEEKATGGVSAKLDYDMECMTDFVAEATMTMLPSSTIMLSMHYLNDRVAHFPETVSTSENQIYRLLAVSLILGSKFLDDNTFINRSWSDVTAIKVSELNQLEVDWLQLIHWELHVDPKASNGLQAWLHAWKEYQEKDLVKHQPARLSPLDTNVLKNNDHRDRYSAYPTPQSAVPSRTYDTPHSAGYAAPPSQYANTSYTSDLWLASERQSSIDDYYRRNNNRYSGLPDLNDYGHQASARQSTYGYPQTAHPAYYQTPAYGSAWDQGAWNAAHRMDCACQTCIYQQHYRPYATSSYTQTVMG
ncbi:cyclin-like protein [Friedmanniomyces endolithicus]|uniref:Cyclin-like protein n=1 Tax=Friedmanniomyces endolithicus TaxID=329885 RepID=A0AAN6J7Q0_9PEZI|nr:cyclin-like protein [Friedmanniomyces endolithicus]KAK0293120.1 cyclin-like protein [Friedmanniomyces endolithicus]KAK0319455.1 cyclin-like protein [Friedmanniomyces endolithicus]KAK0930268.1 cyclin-like protein [Friedmanniomyces endolithicus]KAK0966427.1 cyclin-like protein [Friedmanniomyces endolithicus]